MKDARGLKVQVGDRVRLWNGCTGIVVCSMDERAYTEKYPEEVWSYLQVGILIETVEKGLMLYDEADEDLEIMGERCRRIGCSTQRGVSLPGE